MFDPRPFRVSRPLAMLSVVLLLALTVTPSAVAAPADDDRPSITLDFVLDWLGGWMQRTIDAVGGVIDVNGQPAPTPPPAPAPPEPPPADPSAGDTEGGGVFDPNG